jgi:hypothetical protein
MLISSNFLFQGQREIQYSSVLIFVIVGYLIFFSTVPPVLIFLLNDTVAL